MSKYGEGEIYLIIDKTNNMKYVGQARSFRINGGKAGTFHRWRQHVSDSNNGRFRCPELEVAMFDHGIDNFTVEVLLKCNWEYIIFSK